MNVKQRLESLSKAELDALKLYAQALKDLNERFQPHPAQAEIAKAVLNNSIKLTFVRAGRKFGKDLCLRTPIATLDGFKLLRDVREGDFVFDEFGNPTRVEWVSEVRKPKTYRVQFSDGEVLFASDSHEWMTASKSARKSYSRAQNPTVHPSVVTTEQIKETLTAGKEWNHAIPLAKPLVLPEKELPIDPYLLGVWLGDGSRNSGTLHCQDEEVYVEIARRGYEVLPWHSGGKSRCVKGLEVSLRELGIVSEKRIPEDYFWGSIEQRKSLLAGLMDTDGTIGVSGYCCFDNTNRALADGVSRLLTSLGERPRRHLKQGKLYGENKKLVYRINFKPSFQCFYIQRKIDRWEPPKKPKHRFITAVDEASPREMCCLGVSNPSSLFLAGEGLIPTHNSELVGYLASRFCATKPRLKAYIFAPQLKQVRELYWADGRLFDYLPKHYYQHIDNQGSRITYFNGSFVMLAGADDPDALRGINPDIVFVDEVKDIKPDFFEAMIPNLGANNAPLVVIGTPPKQAMLSSEDLHPYLSLEQEAISRQDGISFHFPSTVNPHIPKSFFVTQKAQLEARGEADVWLREYMAEYTVGGKNAVFPMLSESRHRYPHKDLTQKIQKDRHQLDWWLLADPGSTSIFGALFLAHNRYSGEIFVLDEIYERDVSETATARIYPRMEKKQVEFFPRLSSWTNVYDEAAVWFMNEVYDQFEVSFIPTQKRAAGKKHAEDTKPGLTQIKNALLEDKLYLSDRCENLFFEMRNYFKVNGKLPKKNDHLIDCLRYFVCSSGYELRPEEATVEEDHRMARRGFSMDEDMRAARQEGGSWGAILDEL